MPRKNESKEQLDLKPEETVLKLMVKRYIISNFGGPCKQEMAGCPICDAWFAYRVLFEFEGRHPEVDKK